MSDTFHHFLSHVRRGLAAQQPQTPADAQRAQLEVTLTVEATRRGSTTVDATPVSRTVALLGPGDVLGFQARAIAARSPEPGAGDWPPNTFPSVEFAAPDFPWRFTCAEPLAGDRLLPWLALVVLVEAGPDGAGAEFSELPAGTEGLPRRVRVADPSRSLPDLAQAWRWAHVQIVDNAESTTAHRLASVIEQASERATSRLLCARRLAPRTRYAALVVPTFELGRRAALGLDNGDVGASDLSWNADGRSPLELPYYHRWSFGTGEQGDFEHQVRRIRPRPGGSLGKRWMDCSDPGFGLPGTGAQSDRSDDRLELEGALASCGTRPTPWGQDAAADPHVAPVGKAFREALAAVLATGLASGKPTVRPPRATAAIRDIKVNVDRKPTWVSIRWTTSQPTRGAVVRTDAGGAGEVIGQTELGTTHRVLWRGLVPGTRVTFRITANDGGRSATTGEGTVRLPSLPVMAPPVYGRWHAAVTRLSTAHDAAWVHALNLDPRHRAAAALGTEVVRLNQEALVASAWRQVGEIGAVNDLLQRAQLAREGALGLWQRLDALADGPLLALTAPVQGKVRMSSPAGGTVQAAIRGLAPASAAAMSPAFRRISRPRGPVQRYAHGLRRDCVVALGTGEVTVAGKAGAPEGTPSIAAVSRAADEAAGTDVAASFTDARITPAALGAGISPTSLLVQLVGEARATAVVSALEAIVYPWLLPDKTGPAQPPVDAAFFETTRAAVCAALDPRRTIPARVHARLGLCPAVAVRPDPLDPILWAPSFPQPMCEPLAEVSKDALLPGIAGLAPESVVLLEPNRRFIEAYLCGLNHAMAAELLWRGFPTDQRGSYFRQFWNADWRAPSAAQQAAIDADPAHGWEAWRERYRDIAPLHGWRNRRLGANSPTDAAPTPVVLLFRSDLLRRYPATAIYAVPTVTDGGPARPDFDHPVQPTFEGHLDPDVAWFGFPFSADEARQVFFVIEEPPTGRRFGLDVAAPDVFSSASDLAWEHFPHLPASGYLDGSAPVTAAGDDGSLAWSATTDPSAAVIACVTAQQPVRVAIAAEALLGKK